MKKTRFAAPAMGALAVAILACAGVPVAAAAGADVLPRPPVPFTGKLAPTEEQSRGSYLVPPVTAPEGAPNIVLVLTDDVGFASASTFGGSAPTPTLDRLAEQGLRYNQFHTTAICSPTRAALLTGRNHHAVGMGTLVDIPTAYPGYTGRIPRTAATVARILRDNGYNTAMFGKTHTIPGEERSPAGPFDQWPTGRGFEYFYGFIAGDSDQWQPALYEGITPVDDADRPEGYLFDAEMADKAMNWVHNQQAAAPDKPFFVYYAPGSAHAPHQAPKAWIERFRGKFDHGWDRERELILARQKAMDIVPADTRLAPRPDEVPAWNSLTDNQRKVYARFMEVYAAQLAYQDAQFGRFISELERMGEADNTLVVFVQGDNGSSAEGGATGTTNEMRDLSAGVHELDADYLAANLDVLGGTRVYQGFQNGWSLATDTPFPWFKQLASHLGGVRNGMVVSWPAQINAQGEVRSQYHHVIDVMPTLLEAANIQPPKRVDGIEQQPIDGTSMVYSFDDADAPSTRVTQYYEVNGNRGIYHDGWLASTTPRNMPWNMPVQKPTDTSTYGWELYNLREDFAQTTDVADQYPQKLEELQALFDEQARKNNVYPIQDAGGKTRGMKMLMNGGGEKRRTEYIYWGRDIQLQLGVSPPIFFLPFTVTAEVDIPADGGEGVMLAAGSQFGGWSFYLNDGVPTAFASISGLRIAGGQSRVAADNALSPGEHTVIYDFVPAGAGAGGTLSIFVDGEQVASGDIARLPAMLAGNGETFDTGRDSNVPVSPDYEKEGIFNGVLNKVTVDINMPAQGGSVH